MHFTKIGLEPDSCQCLNFTSKKGGQYARRIKSPAGTEGDFCTRFESDTEKALQIKDNNCEQWCSGQVALSINEWVEDQQDAVILKYLQLFRKRKNNENRQDAVLIFELIENEGVIKSTPTISPDKEDSTHCDLYKSDEFSLSSLKIVNTIRLSDYAHLLK